MRPTALDDIFQVGSEDDGPFLAAGHHAADTMRAAVRAAIHSTCGPDAAEYVEDIDEAAVRHVWARWRTPAQDWLDFVPAGAAGAEPYTALYLT